MSKNNDVAMHLFAAIGIVLVTVAVVSAISLLMAWPFMWLWTTVVRWWMAFVGQEKFATGPCSPWSIIVVDNVLHLVTIWGVWKLITP